MTPEQFRQFRAFVGQALRAPLHPDDPAVVFPDTSIVRPEQDAPRGVPRWATIKILNETGLQGGADQWNEPIRMIYRITFDGASDPVTVTLSPTRSAFAHYSSGAVSPPVGGVEAFRDEVLAVLQAAEGTSHPATYIPDDTGDNPAILATATEAARGVWLDLQVAGPDASAVQVRDALAVHTRDLAEAVLSINVFSKLNGAAPDPSLHAVQLADKIALRSMAPYSTAVLRSFGVAPMRRQPVQDVSGLLGGSEWETRAVLDMTVSVMRAMVEQPGTIESMAAVGTLTSDPATPAPPAINTTE